MAGRYALIVATDAYGDEKLRRLRAPARDAEELARVLRDPEIGDFDVQLLANEADAVLRRRIAAFFGDRSRDDLLLLHFSCHGLKDDSGQLYFAASDTEVAHLDASAVPAEFVSRQMARSRSNSVLMLLDCCYSGAIARGLTFRAGDSVDVNDHLGGHGRAIITASSAMEYAFEGDDLTGEGKPSVFTSAVVKALETGEADRDQDRWISVRELYDYVCDEVRERTPNQRPNMLSHLEGELYIARSRFVAPVELPRELRDALANQLSHVRAGAVEALAELLADPRLAPAAREELERVAAQDDSRRVIAAAEAALVGAEKPVAETPAPVAAEKPAAETPAPVAAEKPAAETPAPVAAEKPAAPVAAAIPAASPPADKPSPAAAPARVSARGYDGVRIGAGAAAAAIVLGWFLPWLNGYNVAGMMTQYSESQGREGVLETSVLVVGILAAALVAVPRAWVVLPALAGWVLGVAGIVLVFSRDGDLGFGLFLALAGAAALVPAGAALALRTRRIAPRAPAWLPAALIAAGGIVIAAILELRSYGEDKTASVRHLVALLGLAAAAVAIAKRPLPGRAATAVTAIGGAAAGLGATYAAWGVIPAAVALLAGGIYATLTRGD